MTAHLKQAYRGGDNVGRPGWFLHLAYDEDVVERIKRDIPVEWRKWDPEKERWWIHLQAEPDLLRIVPGLAAYKAQASLL